MQEDYFDRVLTSNNMAYSPKVTITEDSFLRHLHDYVTLCVLSRAIECGRIGFALKAKGGNVETGVQSRIEQYLRDGTFVDYFLIKALELLYLTSGRFSDNKYVMNCIKESVDTLRWVTGVHIHSYGYTYRQDDNSSKIDWSDSDRIVTNGTLLCNFLSSECTSIKSLDNIGFIANIGVKLNAGIMSSLLSCSIMRHFEYYGTDDAFKEAALNCAVALDLGVQNFVEETLSNKRIQSKANALLGSNDVTWHYIHCLLIDLAEFSTESKKTLLGDEPQDSSNISRILTTVINDIEDYEYEIHSIKRLGKGRF